MTQSEQLSEEYIQNCFHNYLRSSLTQAKVERLLDAEVLSGAEGDLMITGPALCLYFAALRCTTSPPSVPLPRLSKDSTPIDLSPTNCPPTFVSFLHVWCETVPAIQSLTPEHQHDLARIICNLDPVAQPPNITLNGIAADLRAIAIEISQRRSFQDRYASDLQAALDAGDTTGSLRPKAKASFIPPPVYDPSPHSSPASSPQSPTTSLPYHPTAQPYVPLSPGLLSPFPQPPPPPPSPSPTLMTADTPAIELIRETLYATIADVLECTSSLRLLLKSDPPRAYFASVSLAILEVATTAMTTEGNVVGVLGKELTRQQCPLELRPFMDELAAIGRRAKEIENEDTQFAMKCAQKGQAIPVPRIERAKTMLEMGVGHERGRKEAKDGRRSVEGRAVAFTNRINALSLGMTNLKAFKDKQEEVFKVLAGVGV